MLDWLTTIWSIVTSFFPERIAKSDIESTLTTMTTTASMAPGTEATEIEYAEAASEYICAMDDRQLDDLIIQIEDQEMALGMDDPTDVIANQGPKTLSRIPEHGRKPR